MYTVENFVASFEKETAVCINLYGKMPPGGLDYRPTASQRSTLELLRYLAFGPYNTVRRVVAGDWSLGLPTGEVTKDWPASDFPARMRWQADEVARLVRAANPVDLLEKEMTFPWGDTLKRGQALVVYPLNWLTSYRMQLFLYLKAAGASNLSTPDVWHPPKAA
jgi:hypothetical protein